MSRFVELAVVLVEELQMFGEDKYMCICNVCMYVIMNVCMCVCMYICLYICVCSRYIEL